jgi:ATP-dependent DNA helicase RecG
VHVATPADLLAYLPREYKDWRVPTPIAHLVEGDGIALGTVARVKERPGRMPLVTVDLTDESGAVLAAKFFGRRHLFGRMKPGDRLFVAGRIARPGLMPEMNVTSHRELREGDVYAGEIVPVYPATKDLTSRRIRATIAKNLARLAADAYDGLPPGVVASRDFPALADAWREVHAPTSPVALERARKRIVFQEFFAIALAAALKRAERLLAGGANAMPAPPDLLDRFEASLPFRFTGAQRRVIGDIWNDMAQTAPMNRLLQGDVGSGKTLVAAAAIVLAAANGMQAALMAPTEILAQQHADKLTPLLIPFGIATEAVFGSLSPGQKRTARDRLASGEATLAVGTHALIEDATTFRNLGLVVVDEQHRFGVEQRARLRSKSVAPHALAMTATPIPRTLAQVRYADLDISEIDEIPPGRTPIQTFVLRESRKHLAYRFVRQNVERGRQAYVVAPAIELDEDAEEIVRMTRAVEEYDALRTGVFADLRLGLVHGRMPPREKTDVMARFQRREIDVLVATTVVEVGVDVPNASVMVVLDANRYGLAQLHQLRGRVGRGAAESFCVLVAPDVAADSERLAVLEETTDGFTIAEEDLRIRREGEFAGTAQAGQSGGTLGNIVADFALYAEAKRDADAIVLFDPDLTRPEHATLLGLVDRVATARALRVSS